ncbi:MAG: phosphatase PAP2 family protein [Chloroflexi bacterium]|nr:phosphatase PAP2 family protein [Chloroflexota bacterium]
MTDPFFDLGVQITLLVQSLGGWLAAPMQFFSFLGNEEFFLLIMPALFWCVDASLGLRVGTMLMLSNSVNHIFKLAFQSPRPYFYTSEVQALISESSFGIPSGHAQNAAAVWGLLGVLSRRGWVLVTMIVVTFLIGLSRIYLGVHFIWDVLIGWALGAILVWLFLRLEPVVRSRLAGMRVGMQLASIFAFTLVLILISFLVRLSLGAWTLPAAWAENIRFFFPDRELPDPVALAGAFTAGGTLFGIGAGAILLRRWGGFQAGGDFWKRLGRLPLGLIGVSLIWYGLGEVFPRGEFLTAYVLRYVRYMLVGIWVIAVAPRLFVRLGLAQGDEGAEREVLELDAPGV